ncbi:arsenite efflux transporter metallochaperone ArsD [Facklamia sp. DSM 111018]|uniref:Arsenite efflux transporter metallochaperone ArsD n=1 Tax=Facklamia lactis TaxID=2749967 RepID=A0ABS0LSD4_9LACT|nr:arsenite efflux transporter metallochaperone ArsD [Facklamia lactis]
MKLELFEPAMCCETGICGPSFDKNLIEIANIFNQLKSSESVQANRYNLSQSPQAFVENGVAIDLIHKNGKKILPITIVNGEVVKTGAYPSPKEFQEYTGINFSNMSHENL